MLSRHFCIAVALVVPFVAVAVASVVLACEDPFIGIMSPDPGNGPVEGTVDITTWLDEEAEFVKVDFFRDGLLVGTDTTQPFSLPWDTTEVGDGEYNVQVKGTLEDQTVKQSGVVVVQVDNE